jgi:hypothetical protein
MLVMVLIWTLKLQLIPTTNSNESLEVIRVYLEKTDFTCETEKSKGKKISVPVLC